MSVLASKNTIAFIVLKSVSLGKEKTKKKKKHYSATHHAFPMFEKKKTAANTAKYLLIQATIQYASNFPFELTTPQIQNSAVSLVHFTPLDYKTPLPSPS